MIYWLESEKPESAIKITGGLTRTRIQILQQGYTQ